MEYFDGTAEELGAMQWEALGRYRHEVFVRHLGWELPGAVEGAEWDEFDRADTVYVLAQDAAGRLTGCARLLPTTRPYLLANVFPQLLDGQPAPMAPEVWELSRFAAFDSARPMHNVHVLGSPQALDLLRVAKRAAARRGAEQLISVSATAIERILRHGGFAFTRLGQPHQCGTQRLFACSMSTQADPERRPGT
jgi:acyl homoserine lactone synthase